VVLKIRPGLDAVLTGKQLLTFRKILGRFYLGQAIKDHSSFLRIIDAEDRGTKMARFLDRSSKRGQENRGLAVSLLLWYFGFSGFESSLEGLLL
jgi:hypothetical protein